MTLPVAELDPVALVRRSRSRNLGPWTADHLARVVLTNAVALAMVVASWYQASGTGAVRSQLAWLNLGVMGLVLGAASNGLWLLRGREAIGLARMAIIPGRRRDTAAQAPPVSRNGQGRLVAGKLMTRYHRADCPLVSGKAVGAAGRRRHERDGLRPCEVCEP